VGFLLVYNVVMNKTKRFYWHHGPGFYYRIKWQSYKNKYDNNNYYWECEELWFVAIQLFPTELYNQFGARRSWFDYEDTYYDGHTAKALTLFGIRFVKGYTYEAKRIG
jgi:hypothetical protein